MSSTTLIAVSPAMKRAVEDLEWAAKSDAKILITGESGVGKDLAARRVHELSTRARHPMVPINCAGIPDTLLASEMFGHVRGSFTDAHRDRTGWLEQAHRGTVFLDEVGEMSLQMQALLLRFLENGEIQRVGSDSRTSRVDTRVICATNNNLLERVRTGEFREDLYYRLNVINIEIPPLRHRTEDVPDLVRHFMQHLAESERISAPDVHDDVLALMSEYNWPGNVRELRNVVERLMVRWRSGMIVPADLPHAITGARPPADTRGQALRLAPASRAQALYDSMTQHRESFWSSVYVQFKSRDLTRQDLRSVVRLGLEMTRGSYKGTVRLFNMPDSDYKRFLNFLRKHEAHLPVHEFRVVPRPRMEERASEGTNRERERELIPA
jgi:transcriptional regulator with PAS, ATPase and Fis domain